MRQGQSEEAGVGRERIFTRDLEKDGRIRMAWLDHPGGVWGDGHDLSGFGHLLGGGGENILPSPFLCTMTGGVFPILSAGSEEQKKKFLPRIANGEQIFTLAFLEDEGVYKASGVTTKATRRDDDFVIDRKKLFVEKAHIADYLTCVARIRRKGYRRRE